MIALPMAALICDAFGWPAVFYVFGALGLVWCLAWLLLVSNSPAEHKRISAAEREFIRASLGNEIGDRRESRKVKNSVGIFYLTLVRPGFLFGTYLLKWDPLGSGQGRFQLFIIC